MITLLIPSGLSNDRATEDLEISSLKAYLASKKLPVCLVSLSPELNNEQIVNSVATDICFLGIQLDEMLGEKYYSVASLIKQKYPECIVFTYGDLSSNAYEMILQDCQHIDLVVLGDPEEVVFNVVSAVNNDIPLQELESVVTRENAEKNAAHVDLSQLPWADRDFLQMGGYQSAPIYAGRGCCGQCAFCSYHMYYKGAEHSWCGRDMTDVYNEVVALHKEYGINHFMFQDESLEDPDQFQKQRIDEFCDLLTAYPHKLTFWCYMRPNTFRDQDISLIKKMRRSGFVRVYLGFDSNNEQDLKLYCKRNTIDDNARAIRLFTQEGIDLDYGFIMLNPFSDKKTIAANFRFLEHNNVLPTSLYTNRILLYYKTPLYQKCLERGLLTDQYSYLRPDGYRFCHSFISEISEFLNEIYYCSRIRNCNYETRHMQIRNTVSRIKHIFPKELNDSIVKFNSVESEIGQMISSYFSVIYLDNNLDKARENFLQWENQLIQLYQKAYILYAKMIKERDVFLYMHPLIKK